MKKKFKKKIFYLNIIENIKKNIFIYFYLSTFLLLNHYFLFQIQSQVNHKEYKNKFIK